MRFLTDLLDTLAGFVRRNPLTVLLILALAVGAPALLRGIALFILYFMLGIVLLVFGVFVWFRWRIRRVQRQMEEQFGAGNAGPEGFGSPFAGRRSRSAGREGDVKVYKTADAPEKRVSSDVGDYVEFEETREDGE